MVWVNSLYPTFSSSQRTSQSPWSIHSHTAVAGLAAPGTSPQPGLLQRKTFRRAFPLTKLYINWIQPELLNSLQFSLKIKYIPQNKWLFCLALVTAKQLWKIISANTAPVAAEKYSFSQVALIFWVDDLRPKCLIFQKHWVLTAAAEVNSSWALRMGGALCSKYPEKALISIFRMSTQH